MNLFLNSVGAACELSCRDGCYVTKGVPKVCSVKKSNIAHSIQN